MSTFSLAMSSVKLRPKHFSMLLMMAVASFCAKTLCKSSNDRSKAFFMNHVVAPEKFPCAFSALSNAWGFVPYPNAKAYGRIYSMGSGKAPLSLQHGDIPSLIKSCGPKFRNRHHGVQLQGSAADDVDLGNGFSNGAKLEYVSLQVPDKHKTVKFYEKFLGMQSARPTGIDNRVGRNHFVDTKESSSEHKENATFVGFEKTGNHLSQWKLKISTPESVEKQRQLLEDRRSGPTHGFLGLGINVGNADFVDDAEIVEKYGGSIRDYTAQRPLTPSMFPDEHATLEKFCRNAFIFDPNSFGLEIVEYPSNFAGNKVLKRVRLYTSSLKEASHFYSKVLGMQLVQHTSHLMEKSHPWDIYAAQSKTFGYGPSGAKPSEVAQNEPLLQMAYAYDEDVINIEPELQYVAISTPKIEAALEHIRAMDWLVFKEHEFLDEPFLSSRKSFVIKDPDGYKFLIYQT